MSSDAQGRLVRGGSAAWRRLAGFARWVGGSYVALFALLLVCAASSAAFRNPANLLNIMHQCSFSGMIALGMTFVIISGGIDLSVGSAFALSGVVAALAYGKLGMAAVSPAPALALVALVAMLVGLGCGMANGALVAPGRLPPFIATLGTYSIFRSLALYLAASGTIMVDSELLYDFTHAKFLGVITPIWAFLGMTILLDAVLSLTKYGKHSLAVGASERVALFAGIRAGTVKFASYAVTGLCAGISVFLFMGRMGSITSSNDGLMYELDAIAAVIIGGTAMSGGRGTVRGTLAGALILGVVSNILDLWAINVDLQGLVKGLVIIVSVLIQRKGITK